MVACTRLSASVGAITPVSTSTSAIHIMVASAYAMVRQWQLCVLTRTLLTVTT